MNRACSVTRHLMFAGVGILALRLAPPAASTLVLRNAGSNVNTMIDGELVSTLRGNVVFEYDDVTIRSEYARWRRSSEVVDLRENVNVTRGEEVLTCDRMHYDGREETLSARGDVRFRDNAEQVEVSGRRCTYDLRNRHCVLTGDPVFTRLDTAAAETLTIKARRMTYDDSAKVTTAREEVRITKGQLSARCEEARYYTEAEIAMLRKSPDIAYGDQQLRGDSVDLMFRRDTLDAAEVVGDARGLYVERSEGDTTRTHVRGDSIFMALTDAGFLDSVYVCRNVRSTHFSRGDSLRGDEVTGRDMILAFGEKGSVRSARVVGNAQSLYYLEEGEGEGTNEAGGDTLSVWFSKGEAVRLRFSGGVRGVYSPR